MRRGEQSRYLLFSVLLHFGHRDVTLAGRDMGIVFCWNHVGHVERGPEMTCYRCRIRQCLRRDIGEVGTEKIRSKRTGMFSKEFIVCLRSAFG